MSCRRPKMKATKQRTSLTGSNSKPRSFRNWKGSTKITKRRFSCGIRMAFPSKKSARFWDVRRERQNHGSFMPPKNWRLDSALFIRTKARCYKMNATDKNCAEMQNLLIKKDFDELTERENFLIAEHVQHCEGCRAFQSALIQIQYSMQPGDDEPLAPDPAIRRNLRNRIQASKSSRRAS